MADEYDFAPALAAIEAFQGYGIERLAFSAAESGDAMEISLMPFSGHPWMALSLREIHYFAMDRQPHEEMTFFDFTARVLPPREPWPAGLPSRPAAGAGKPSLLWLHGEGPSGTLDVVATMVQALTEFRR